MKFDLYLFNLIHGFAGKWQWLNWTGVFFARYFEYVLWLVLILFLIKDFKKYWRMVAEAVVAAAFVRFFLVKIIGLLKFRFRPFAMNGVNSLIPYEVSHTSFPSGHASFYFALSTIIYSYNKKAGILFFAGSFLIVISRVFVGVHWPSDILAGAFLGIIMGVILNKLFRRVHYKKGH